jgi:hypothetical protein
MIVHMAQMHVKQRRDGVKEQKGTLSLLFFQRDYIETVTEELVNIFGTLSHKSPLATHIMYKI